MDVEVVARGEIVVGVEDGEYLMTVEVVEEH